MKHGRTCGYCYNHKKSSHRQKLIPAVGEVEGIPACRAHWRKLAPGSSAFRYTTHKPA